MSIEVGDLVLSYNGKNQGFYGFVSAKGIATDRWNRQGLFYTTKHLVYEDGRIVKRPTAFRSKYANLATPEIVRLTCSLFRHKLENMICNARLPGEDGRDAWMLDRYLGLLELTQTRYDLIFAQLANYVDPRGI